MFFVSKVLSFFVFPLGAACLLIGFALAAQFYRHFRLAMIANLAALVVLWLMGSRIVAGALLRPLEMHNLPPSPMPSADAIVVLGGCTEAAFPPQPTVHLVQGADRIVYAAELLSRAQGAIGRVERRRRQRMSGVRSDGRNHSAYGRAQARRFWRNHFLAIPTRMPST